MEDLVSKKMVNELLKQLGHSNIQVVDKPIFYWNGSVVTNDETAPIKTVSSLRLADDFRFHDFLKKYKYHKLVFYNVDGGLIDTHNQIRVFID